MIATPGPAMAAQYTIRYRFARGLVAAACLLLAVPGAAGAASPGATLRQYLDSRLRGDSRAASALWDPADLDRCEALGTHYPTLEARYDDNLLYSAAERAALSGARPVVPDSVVDATWARFRVVLGAGGASPPDTLQYLLRKLGDTWLLTSPTAGGTASWTSSQGRFYKLRASKLRNVNADALAALDAGIHAMLDRLGTSAVLRLRLERIKVEYYLCDSEAEVRALTGSNAPSQYLLAGERVVTRTLPDLNAVERVVLHLTLHETPPRCVPLLEEGLAAGLGGLPGSSASVVLQRGRALATASGSDPQSLFDGRRMRAASAETSVPMAALWSASLLRGLGPTRFQALYRSLSGSATETLQRDAAQVRQALESATSQRGPGLVAWVRTRADSLPAPLRAGCENRPSESAAHHPMIRWRDLSETWQLHVFVEGPDLVFVVRPYEGAIPAWQARAADSIAALHGVPPAHLKVTPPVQPSGEPPQLALLFKSRGQEEPDAYESALFSRHFATRRYAGYFLGLFMSPDAARLYDYRTEQVIGCYSKECAPPSSSPYYDKADKSICFRMSSDLLPRALKNLTVMAFPYNGE